MTRSLPCIFPAKLMLLFSKRLSDATLKEKSFSGAQMNHYVSDLNYEELSVIVSKRYFFENFGTFHAV